MPELSEYVEHSLAQGLSREAVIQMLLAEGWPADHISHALVGCGIPKPPSAIAEQGIPDGGEAAANATITVAGTEEATPPLAPATPAASPQPGSVGQQPGRPSLSPAIAAMHHVFLWFFAGSSAFAIGAAVAVLMGRSPWIGSLNNFIAVVAITMSVYLGFYWVYLRKALRPPFPSAHRVWTTITICLFGVSSMSAATVLIINLLDGASTQTVVTSLLILVLYVALLINYVAATFLNPMKPLRKIILVSAVPFVALVLVVLFAISVASLAPLKRDETVRDGLVAASESVVSYVEEHDRLPRDAADLSLSAAVSYQRKSDVTYELCATFERNSQGSGYSSEYSYGDDDTDDTIEDRYLDSYDFRAPAGESCFTLTSALLTEEEQDALGG